MDAKNESMAADYGLVLRERGEKNTNKEKALLYLLYKDIKVKYIFFRVYRLCSDWSKFLCICVLLLSELTHSKGCMIVWPCTHHTHTAILDQDNPTCWISTIWDWSRPGALTGRPECSEHTTFSNKRILLGVNLIIWASLRPSEGMNQPEIIFKTLPNEPAFTYSHPQPWACNPLVTRVSWNLKFLICWSVPCWESSPRSFVFQEAGLELRFKRKCLVVWHTVSLWFWRVS